MNAQLFRCKMHGTWALNYHISNIYSSSFVVFRPKELSTAIRGIAPWASCPAMGLYFKDDGDFERAPVLFLSHRSLSSCSGVSDAQIVLVLVLVVVF
jgi:hypothetical protein